MRVYALWWGGSDYRYPEHGEAELFSSIARAETEFWARSGDPLVGDDTHMRLYASDPEEAHDPYPSWELTIGPRGGIRREPC